MLFFIIYHMPLWMPIAITIITVIVWASLMARIYSRNPHKVQTINNVLNIIAFFGILAVTVLNRSDFNDEVVLMPFHSFTEAKIQKEIYRTMIMNIFLFVPLGICMPYSLKSSSLKRVSTTILFALIISIAIEFYQFVFSCGRCETDDVICNTLGAVIGSISYIKYRVSQKKREPR